MSQQRRPVRIPEIGVPNQLPADPREAVKSVRWILEKIQVALREIGKSQVDAYGSPLKKHAATHLQTGGDPLQTPGTPTAITPDASGDPGSGPSYALEDHTHAVSAAAPTNATGTAAAEGSSDSFMRADATIKQGIVAHKGALVTYDTAPAELTVGANGYVLTADSGQAKGVKWAPAPGSSTGFSDFHPFLLLGA